LLCSVMGPTGSGKSTFINTATGAEQAFIGHSLESCTQGVQAIHYRHPRSNRDFVFVDTPGFDDTNMDDIAILSMIADWLERTYKQKIFPTALLFLHRITDNRMPNSALRNLTVFMKLCGARAFPRVMLVTTMWDEVTVKEGEARETELCNSSWQAMISAGAGMFRFNQRFYNDSESAHDILQLATQKGVSDLNQSLLLQRERIDYHLHLGETQAGRALYNDLQRHIVLQTETLTSLRERVSKSNPQLAKELRKEIERLQGQLRASFDQSAQLKTPFLQHFISLFLPKPKGVRLRFFTIPLY
ncbi:hypothetical protein M422DRAFT_169621, partial [Sphaerobolus stellatus SS14]